MALLLVKISLSLLLLYAGAELLVRGSSALAVRFRVSPMVIGMTIVAFGTSAPELFVSLKAGLAGSGDIALGNVIGSNICNIGLILGLAALLRPLRIHLRTVRLDVPVMIGATLMLSVFLMNGRLGRAEGVILLSGFIVFAALIARSAAKEAGAPVVPGLLGTGQSGKGGVALDLSLVAAGLAALGFGADLLIKGAVGISGMLGVGEAFVGLTVVAVGTSIPELATSTVAALRGESDISVGNIIGSNIFNALGILGLSSTVRPLRGDGIDGMDLLFMSGFALLALPFMRTGFMMKRWEGVVLLVLYGAYLFFLVTS